MRATDHATDQVISIEVFPNEVSKTDVLTQGDEVGVFSSIEGTEQYFLEHVKFIVGADGRSLSTTPAVYYPEAKQAVRFFACFPYHSGVFSVPSDQSMALALKQADLCWATASSTPVASAVPLQLEHKLARLLIAANDPITKIVAPNVFSGGTLNIRTGVFTNTLKSDISTTGTELILPAQTIERLILTIAGVDYTFEGALSLEAAKTTTANLTLNPSTKTATLSGSSTTAWTTATRSGDPNSPIINQLKLHWVAPHAAYAKADKVTLTIENPTTKATKDIDVTPTLISGESSTAVCAYTLPVSLAAGSGFWYPYTVTRARIYQGATLLREAIPEAMRGTTIYRSGAQSLAINMYIQVRDAATNTTEIKEWLNVDKNHNTLQVKITTLSTEKWQAVVVGGDGVYVLPSSGKSGDVVTVCWPLNPTTAPKAGRTITFSLVGFPLISQTITTNQQAGPGGVMINNLLWATGNLVATGSRGAAGVGGMRVGAPSDPGLFFQFGSLIGYKGGAQINGGSGVGVADPAIEFWGGGSSYTWEGESYIWPTNLVGTKTTWPRTVTGSGTATLNEYYFNYATSGWENSANNIRSFASLAGGTGTLGSGRYASRGVGDPCTYYLDTQWRLPTSVECAALTNKIGYVAIAWEAAGLTARLVVSGATIGGQAGPGAWIGSMVSGTVTPDLSRDLYLPMTGLRTDAFGGISRGNGTTTMMTCITSQNSDMMTTGFNVVSGVFPANGGQYRSAAGIVRCVRLP